MSAIILAGGESLRTYPYNKVLFKFGNRTLLGYQIEWITRFFNHVIVATTEYIYNDFLKHDGDLTEKTMLDFSLEWDKLGTSGALLRACDYTSSKKVYVFNVDDILCYNPMELYTSLLNGKAGVVALSKPRLAYGLVRIKNGLICRFDEKPHLKEWVSTGHYTFDRVKLADYLVEKGSLERDVLPLMAKDKMLQGYKTKVKWLTVNTFKDYVEACRELGLKSDSYAYT